MAERALIAVVLAVGVALLGCSSPSGDGCPAPETAPATETALMPAGLSLAEVGTVTDVQKSQGHLTVRAVTGKPIDEVTVLIQNAVTAAGYRPAGMDNEGFEAEVFFTAGAYAAGQALVRRAACEGQWDVELVLIDPSAVRAPTPTPTSTPRK
ncbi:hypothetical protein Kfla_3208 [Kribbella flavida DSM 17836]|uniref:Lipoprotein n=1 Tax=Kribbella flavida (strain DSM 17836 / JCM 10339 / NBRC 14399) TaxID=479435 RepID=D2Q4F6_KRIFD|nr:hypothetical protein [Kribbella flavida]ADB32270.1 hypothetical protein Kfla_3208 [Kribbella flavida DSM 17836]